MTPPPLPIRTERLLLRPFAVEDAPTFAAYRNDPDVAHLQDWDLPYTEEDARRMIDSMAALDWPVLGEWFQLAIEQDGRMIGDVGVHRSVTGLRATLGYTLRADRQGRGLATEAVGAAVDRLFALTQVHRIGATLDPDNAASARLLERLGFRYEGRAVGAARAERGSTTTAMHCSRRTGSPGWRGRGTHRPSSGWSTSTAESRDEVGRLATTHSQERFVAPVARSYAEALLPDPDPSRGTVVARMRAIRADGRLVGFMMLAEPTPTEPDPFLWRLLVDRWHQGRGIGTSALGCLVDELRANGHRRLLVGWNPGRGGPERFYLRLGFVPTGEIIDGGRCCR